MILALLVARGLPRDTENIPVYWKNFTSGLFLQSAFSVSISGQHKGQHLHVIKEDTIARPVCLLKRARVGALSEGNMVEATHLMRKVQTFRVDYALCRIKQMLVLKNG